MLDSTGILLYSTFSPWTSTQNITEEEKQKKHNLHIHTCFPYGGCFITANSIKEMFTPSIISVA